MNPLQRAWLTIAEAFDTPYKKRTSRQRKITSDGLCSALYTSKLSAIHEKKGLAQIELEKLKVFKGSPWGVFLFPVRSKTFSASRGFKASIHDKKRAALARRFVKEAGGAP